MGEEVRVIEVVKVAMGIAALALLVIGVVVFAIVAGTLGLIARDRIEDLICTFRRNRRRRRGEL